MIGPLPASMSNGMPMPVRGVSMSENRMTPSGLKARHGCIEISTCSISAVTKPGHRMMLCNAMNTESVWAVQGLAKECWCCWSFSL